MRHPKALLLLSIAFAALSTLGPFHAAARAASNQPLHILVPFAAGGAADLVTRTLGERITAATGQPVVVENKPGGGTVIASQAVYASPADGQTLLVVSGSFVINQHLMKLSFDPLKDFVPVTLMASNPHVLLVSDKIPARTLPEFIEWAKSRNGAGSYASFGAGSSGHLGFELLKMAGRFDMVHIPYKGEMPALADVMGGQVDAMLGNLPQAIEQIKVGRVHALAVGSATRAPTLPQVPTFAEGGIPNFISASWFGLVMKKGTPPERVAELNHIIAAALHEPSVRAKLVADGMDVDGGSAADFGKFLADESAKYAKAVKFSGTRLD